MIELGKPADYGQFILERRYRLARSYTSAAMDRGGFYLDVGCGNGAQTVYFAKHFSEWLAIDVEEKRLEEFRQELQRGEYPAASAKHAIELYDGEKIPVDSGTIDFLTCIEVVEHTRDDAATMKELARVLKPGGTAVVTVPNKWWIFETHGANLPLLPWNRVPFFSWLPKALHAKYAKARIYRKHEIETLARGAGFTIEHSGYVTAPMDMIKQKQIQQAVRKSLFANDETVLPILATSVMLILTK